MHVAGGTDGRQEDEPTTFGDRSPGLRRIDGHVVVAFADVDPGAIRVNDLQTSSAHLLACHLSLPQHPHLGCAGDLRRCFTLLNEVALRAISDSTPSTGRITLLNGCFTHHCQGDL